MKSYPERTRDEQGASEPGSRIASGNEWPYRMKSEHDALIYLLVWAVYLIDSASREAIHPWCQSQGRMAGLKSRIEVRDRAGQRRRFPARVL